MERTYESAVAFLRSRSRVARPTSTNPINVSHPVAQLPTTSPTFRGKPSIEGMREWLLKLGHTDRRIDSLNIIHVAGTKGKGSTCAFIESFLRVHGERTGFPRKTGLYTSPHLIEINERIRINFAPLPKDSFAQNVFEVRDGLSLRDTDRQGPRYLQLLALISYHTFLKENVDVAIYETHHGGQYDATNVVQHPVVTAITSIGMDHVEELGPSIENIAWHKAGIFKPGAPAFSHPQVSAVAQVFKDRAAEKGVTLKFVEPNSTLSGSLTIKTQISNASLAVEVSNAFLELKCPGKVSSCLTERDIAGGIQRFQWPGRFQLIPRGKYLWCLDGAHNELSIGEAAAWFQQVSCPSGRNPPMRILIFAHKPGERDGLGVLKRLSETLHVPIQHAIFTTAGEDQGPDRLLEQYGPRWKKWFPHTEVWNESVPGQAVARATELGHGQDEVHILVTGSLYLVGSILRHLGDSVLE